MTMWQTNGQLTTRDLTTDDLDAAFDVRSRSFGPLSPSMRDWWNGVQQESMSAHRAIGIFDGERLLAHARVRSYQQFWGGRPMSMGGVAGVVVAPDARGRGVGSLLMRGIARRSHELGDLVSALYPATIPLYRALGWEVVGAQHRTSISAEALRTLGGKDVSLRAATESDVEPFVKSVHDRYSAQRASGPKLPSVADAREQLTGDGMMSYVTDGGHVVFEWRRDDLVVSYLSADTPETARALWSVVGSGSSIATKVEAYIAPDDPIHLLLPEEVAHETYLKRWMLRIMDAPKAVAARGFSPAVTGSAAVTLVDPLLSGNCGSWRLEVSAGRGELIPAEPSRAGLCLGPNGFAALYAGTSVRVLRTAGLASAGEPEGDELIDAAFAGRTAYLLEYF
jgi:predicted acetyltransferase